MQSPTSPTARALIERARASAAERRTHVTTLHLLGAALDGASEVSGVLRARGVRALDVRQAFRAHHEPEGAFPRLEPRARRIAQAHGCAEVTERHLLAAAFSDPESAAAAMLVAMRQDPNALAAALVQTEAVVAPPARVTVAARAAPVAVAQGARAPTTPTTPGAMTSRARLSPVDQRKVGATPEPSAPPPQPSRAPARPARREGRPEAGLSPRATPLLFSLLMPHATQGAAADVLGRDVEVERVRDALGRRGGRGALIVGAPGSGRSAVLRAFAARAEMPVARLPHAELVAAMRGPQAERYRALGEELGRARGEVVLALDPVAPWLSPRETPEELVLEMRAQLASNAVPWVGVATPEEARRLIEAEPWLERSVVRVELDELPQEQLREVVTAHARALAEHHGVAVDEALARRALELSERYLGGRAQPDRAIGVLDLAASRARRQGASALQHDTLASVVAELGGVPLARVASSDHERLVSLEEHVARRVVGHREAVARIAHVVRRNAVGFRGTRPMGTFLFLGPTGVGKTETAKAIAEVMFPGSGSLVRLDMGEFSEAHAVARLVGAPPGYVGYTDGGQLSEAVRRRPWCVVLLDEIEKAHRDVLEALLALLDEGRLTDGRGRTTDFRNTVVVMTSNLGAEVFGDTARAIGFTRDADASSGARDRVLAAARASMPPELWNRIDEPLVFAPLSRADVAEVAARMLRDASARLAAEQGVTLSWDASVVDLLMDRGGYEPSLGARPMRRTIARLVESPVADAVLRAELRRGDRVALTVRDGALSLDLRARDT